MEFLLKGGVLIWPILLGSLLGLWVIVERILFVTTVLPQRRSSIDKLADRLAGNNLKPDLSGIEGIESFSGSIDTSIKSGHLNRALITVEADRLVAEVEKNLSYLNVIAQSAPLLGLLGTVIGMIDAFMRIQELTGQVNPSDLAGGIWQALITTAAGLTVAIPALIAYIGFNRIADRYARFVESRLSHIIHCMNLMGVKVD